MPDSQEARQNCSKTRCKSDAPCAMHGLPPRRRGTYEDSRLAESTGANRAILGIVYKGTAWALLHSLHNYALRLGLASSGTIPQMFNLFHSSIVHCMGNVSWLLRAGLLYWLNLNSHPPHAHVRCLLYTLGVPFFLVHVMTPIAMLSVFTITRTHYVIMHWLTNGISMRSITWTLAAAAPLLLVLILALRMGDIYGPATISTVNRAQAHLLTNSSSTAAALNRGVQMTGAMASRKLSEAPKHRREKYTIAAFSYIEAKRSYFSMIGARRWGLLAGKFGDKYEISTTNAHLQDPWHGY